MFLIDMVLIFQSAFYDDNMRLVTNRKTITILYLKGWFLIDFLAIFPTDIFLQGSSDLSDGGSSKDWNEFARVTRLGRLYKLVKLTRLFRILKIIKQRSRIAKYMQDFLKISIGFERLFFFIVSSLVFTHIVSCLWIVFQDIARTEEELESSEQMDMNERYWMSVYFTITTITTVGYGDVSGANITERFFCIFLMISGVVSFSYATGMLTQIMANLDS